MAKFEFGKLLYENPLSMPEDVNDWRLEGDASITFPRQRMRLENMYERDEEKGRHGHFIFWCPENFPADIALSWKFMPHTDAGLAMIWFAATGRKGEDLFDPDLAQRNGVYGQYHHGDINAHHLAYYRRNPPHEIRFRICHLRKSYGHYSVAKAGDPLPDCQYANDFYQMQVIKCENAIRFYINNLLVISWDDDGETYGPVLGGGKIGFRQMAGLIADYSDFRVHEVTSAG